MGLHPITMPAPGSIPGGSNKRARSSIGRAAVPSNLVTPGLLARGAANAAVTTWEALRAPGSKPGCPQAQKFVRHGLGKIGRRPPKAGRNI